MITLAPPSFCLPAVGCPVSISGDLAHAAASAVLGSIDSSLNSAADWLVGHVMDMIGESTTPHLGAGWFTAEIGRMHQVALLVLLPVLMAATIGPVLRQDGRRLARVWGIGLPLALLAGFAGSQVAGLAVAATDELCAVLTGPHSATLGRQFSGAMSNRLVADEPYFVQMVLAGLTVAGTVMVWLELMVRSAAVYVATLFMPLALVGYVWPASASVARRAIELLVSLVLSKLVIVACLSLGLAAMSGTGIDATMSGAAILLLAGFAPFTLLRLAPVVEASAIAHLEGLSRRPIRAAGSATTSAAGIRSHPAVALLMSAGSAGARAATGATSAVAPQGVPERAADFLVTASPSPGSAGPGSAGPASAGRGSAAASGIRAGGAGRPPAGGSGGG